MRRAYLLALCLGLVVALGCGGKKAEEPKEVLPPPKEGPKGASVPGAGGDAPKGAGANTGTPGEKAPVAMP